ncbi:RNA pol III initiation factor TFIIIC subunit [Scheffersomyces stipitis CBS 6054]|uniref:RNA pol III initiation factor TFIIIC subunit n=1 Tax=Scheffersomyces stipitis (strain ATCC 58785 / CBS 6054 / NBRC 10063 / NRRL Y-11545) TaxID=322104 RepID=A3LUC2_PICST|nr:RNA pol III initiation factor TFIIIC subunit [Scheffersomyces stipitis CBS 6054]ABN66213.2 RNA pol III initiation factor TFIIIC subunit [Scheffersomyces stipitis CBS 6054]
MSSNVFETNEGAEHVNEANRVVRDAESDDEEEEMEDAMDIERDEQVDALIEGFGIDSDDEDEDDGALFLSSSEDDFGSDGEPIEDDYNEDYNLRDALRSAGNFKVRKKKSTAKSFYRRKVTQSENRDLDPEVRSYMSQANEAFAHNDYQVARNLYLEVVRLDKKNYNAYKTLGEISQHQGKLNQCCSYWFIAANLRPWDSKFWGDVAELSTQLGHTDQALFCYNRAISSEHKKSARFILQRALVYKEIKQFGRALEGFQRVRQQYPTDASIVKNLAAVYVEQKRLNDAINLYMRILDSNIHPNPQNKQKYPKFTWAELNILLELYVQQHSWRVAIKVTRLAARWIQGREKETWWDENDDDSEFDPKRRNEVIDKLTDTAKKAEAKEKPFELPIDIRYKIGILRLGLDQRDEALHHFEFLLDEQSEIPDLLKETGKALEENGYHEEALQFLTRAIFPEDTGEQLELVNLLGKCYLEIGDYSQAKSAYTDLLTQDSKNLDYKLALAEALYHLGEEVDSKKLLVEVSKESHKSLSDVNDELDKSAEESLSLIKSSKFIRSKTAKLTDQEKLEIENHAKRRVLEIYRRMERLEESTINGDEVAISAWMQLASQLVDMFMSVRSFFPRDKNRTFKGIVLYRRKKQMGIDEKLARVYNLYEGITNDENYSRQFLTSKTEYRGLNYDQWFVIFLQYVIYVSKFDHNTEYANEIVEVAMSVSVFVQDKNKEALLRILKLKFGIERSEASSTVTTFVRFFLISNQFSPFVYKFFICCFASGIKFWETFTNYNHQKFFLRQLKAHDSIILNKKITGMATITADLKDTTLPKEHPDLLYVYANLLGGSRSYVSSVVYLNRAYRHYDRDPMICLVLGLAHVHRSMQRLSSNRHIQLLQGISYVLEYRDHRKHNSTSYELQEIEYNFGRLFHMLGLSSLAVNHYNKVLEYHDELSEDPTYDLSVDAAYNLTLIYNINGNTQLARRLMEKYLTV